VASLKPAPNPAWTPSAASAEGAREFEFSREEFQRVRRLIYEHAGISLAETKQEMVYSRLARRLRARGLRGFGDYLDLLQRGDAAEWEAFVNALTTNLTAFFREPHHFPVLAEHLRARRSANPATIWCAACSTGEEAYSIAMTAAEVSGDFRCAVRVLATDLDTNVLATAEAGLYGPDRLEPVSAERIRRHFSAGTPPGGKSRVRDELRSMISFRRLNLLDAHWPLRGPFDAIFCRNVLIYFDKATQRRILERFAPLLAPSGLLFVGHSEALHNAHDLFRSRGRTVYELAPPAGQGRV
jgi:chemotaxis protein methyltransferase CheR